MDLVRREIQFDSNKLYTVDINKPVIRYTNNPILTAAEVNRVWQDPKYQVTTVHNAGITRFNGEYIMLFRCHLRCGISVIGMAKSQEGISDWTVENQPLLVPAAHSDIFSEGTNESELIDNESGGLEDPRITKIGNEFAITYSAYHHSIKDRVRVSLISTRDFISFKRHGPLHDSNMRNVVIFPDKFQGRYVALFRQNDSAKVNTGGAYSEIKLGYADDWRQGGWEIDTMPIMQTGFGPSPFQDKIGPGAPLIKSNKGWLNLFHGVRNTMDGNPYVLGIALHDLNDPAHVKMSSIPILLPTQSDCMVSRDAYIHVPHVVFCCGAIKLGNGQLRIYYGGNDTVMNICITHEDVLIALCEKYGQDPLTGKLLFNLNPAATAR
ncbi:MAG: glycosidase [Gammaproteobacteria bacterium]|nr:glycosidase [Gammaproteobacteria bacterium]